MLIIAKQDNVDNLFAIWSTVTDEFFGVDLGYNECIGIVMDCEDCPYEIAKSRVDHPQPFDDIAKHIYRGFEPDWTEDEPEDMRNAVRLIVNCYKSNENFRNAFLSSISSALKDLPKESDLEDVTKAIADRIMGEE